MPDFDAYARRMEALMADADTLGDDAVSRAKALLEEVRKEIVSQIASTDWAAHRIEGMKRAVQNAMSDFSSRYGAEFADMQAKAWGVAVEYLDQAAMELGLGAIPQIDQTALGILQGYSADLITGATDDAIRAITREIQMGILAGRSLQEVMEAIGRSVTEGEVGKLASRLERIVRTESASVYQKARQARFDQVMEIMQKDFPLITVFKKWIHSGKGKYARKNHKRLNGEMRPVGKDFPGGIPYPHAPGLPAKEVVNCGCTHVLVFPGMKGYPGDQEDIYDGGPFA